MKINFVSEEFFVNSFWFEFAIKFVTEIFVSSCHWSAWRRNCLSIAHLSPKSEEKPCHLDSLKHFWNLHLNSFFNSPLSWGRDLSVSCKSGVNFTNVLWAAFALVDPKSAKKTVKLSSFFALLGSAHVKAARRMLVKLTPGINFTNQNVLLTFMLKFYPIG